MISEKQLLQKIKHLKYFDKQLSIDRKKVDNIPHNNPKTIANFQKELTLVSKLLTIHTFLHLLPEDYSNPATKITKKEYKTLCLNKVNANSFGAIERVGGMYFSSEEEWDLFLNTYKKLTNESV